MRKPESGSRPSCQSSVIGRRAAKQTSSEIALRARRLRMQDGIEAIEGGGEIFAGYRHEAVGGEVAQQFELHGVVEIAAIRRIQALDTGRRVGASQAEDAAQREAVGTAGELLQ